MLDECPACYEVILARRARLDALIDEQSRHAEWAALVGRLRCTRGINTPTAIGLVADR